MKRFFVIFLSLALALSLAACKSSDTAVNDTSVPEETAQSAPAAPSSEAAVDVSEKETEQSDTVSNSENEQSDAKDTSEEAASDAEQSSETADQVSDRPYRFTSYDDGTLVSEKRHVKIENYESDITVYIVPQGWRSYVEAYQDDILVDVIQLREEQDKYWQIGMGRLVDNDTWGDYEDELLKTGRRYDITMNEPGMWQYNIWEMDTHNVTEFFFEVKAAD